MSYQISKESLLKLTPQKIRMYLQGSGWKNTYTKPQRYHVYTHSEVESQIIIPDKTSFSDYVPSIENMLELISNIKGVSIFDVYSDVYLLNTVDSIQYRISDQTCDGTISASMMNDIIKSHRGISASAYMDIAEPEKYHKSCMKGYAALRNMRIGQTSYGSYVMRFIYPYYSKNQATIEDDGVVEEDPYLKKIVSKIIESSKVVLDAAEDNVTTLENNEISYNFVDSLMALQNNSVKIEIQKIDFGLTTSPDNPILEFEDYIFPRIGNIVEELKPKELNEIQKFNGWLSKSEKGDLDDDEIKFSLNYIDEGVESRATLILSGESKNMAIDSIKENKYVKLEGVLTGYSKNKKITDVSNFKVISY